MPSLKNPIDDRTIHLISDPKNSGKWFMVNSQGGVINFESESLTNLKQRIARDLDDKPSKLSLRKTASLWDSVAKGLSDWFEIRIIRKRVFANRGMLRSVTKYSLFFEGIKLKDDAQTLSDLIIYGLPIMFKKFGLQKTRNIFAR